MRWRDGSRLCREAGRCRRFLRTWQEVAALAVLVRLHSGWWSHRCSWRVTPWDCFPGREHSGNQSKWLACVWSFSCLSLPHLFVPKWLDGFVITRPQNASYFPAGETWKLSPRLSFYRSSFCWAQPLREVILRCLWTAGCWKNTDILNQGQRVPSEEGRKEKEIQES